MNIVKCSGLNCPEVFITAEPVSKNAKFTCRNHVVLAPNHSRFQRYAHDRKLGKAVGKKPGHE